MWQIESTYKARDVEEFLDRYFYRPFGYGIALVARRLKMSPNAVTIMSIFVGVVAGHLFYYTDLLTNVIGMALFVVADAMDSADGQLARMTNAKSRTGRILDGFAGNLMYISVYTHFSLRIIEAGGSWWIFGVAVIAGLSHSFQAAMADYYRNAYLHFVYGHDRSELDRSSAIAALNSKLTWRKQFVLKFLVRIYLNYMYQQEALARHFGRLLSMTQEKFGGTIPEWFSKEYAARNRPLLKYYNILTTNTRNAVMFACIFLNVVWLYFFFEIVVLNLLLGAVTLHQERLNRQLLHAL